eukprot:8481304-Pyramimonas_sp.AAC.1
MSLRMRPPARPNFRPRAYQQSWTSTLRLSRCTGTCWRWPRRSPIRLRLYMEPPRGKTALRRP